MLARWVMGVPHFNHRIAVCWYLLMVCSAVN